MPKLIDSHCHIHLPGFDASRDAAFQRMAEQNVWAIAVGTTVETSLSAIRVAEAHENVWATVGYHPEHLTSSFHDAAEGEAGEYSATALEYAARSSPKVVAIGETGLDFFRIDPDRLIEQARQQQESIFREHVRLACQLNLPVVIHCREALTRLAEIIQDERRLGYAPRFVVHCYTGTWEEARPLLDLGGLLSFTGIVTFPPKKTDDPERHVHRVIERMPLERLLIETDAPWLAPIPFRGQPNEPTYVRFIAEHIARLRHLSFDEVAQCTTEHARAFFRI